MSNADAPSMRLPVVTWLLVAVCVSLHLTSQRLTASAQEAASAHFSEATAYLVEHPYLLPGPHLETRIDPATLSSHQQLLQHQRDRQGLPPIPKRVQARRQEVLDGLVSEALERVDPMPVERWGLHASSPQPLTFVTHIFCHAGWAHLLASAVFLLVLGFALERAWGPLGFALFVPFAAAASGAAFVGGNPGSSDLLIGMQGVIAALLAAYLARSVGRWFDPAYVLVLVSGVVGLGVPVVSGHDWSVVPGLEGAPGVSWWAFAGGGFFGLCVAFGARLYARSKQGAAAAPKQPVADNRLLDRALEARRIGRYEEALSLISQCLRTNSEDRASNLAMWDVCCDLVRPAEGGDAMLRAIRDELRCGEDDLACKHWLEMRANDVTVDAEPAMLTRLAILLRAQDQPAAATEALRRALDACNIQSPGAVESRGAGSADPDRDVVHNATWRALGGSDLEPVEREGLESLLEVLEPERGSTREPLDLPESSGGDEVAEPVEVWEDDALRPGDTGTREGFRRASAIDIGVMMRTARILDAAPLELDENGLSIESTPSASSTDPSTASVKKRVPFDRIEAISVVAIEGLAEQAVMLVDLLLNWNGPSDEPLSVVRLRNDAFDARQFVPDAESPLDALRAFITRLLRESGAMPLPDEKSAQGLPFAAFDDLASYERDILSVEEPED